MFSSERLLLATQNPGKVRELGQLLSEAPYQLVSLDAVGLTGDVAETAETLEENALLKARTYAHLSGLLTVADDSGLEVEALGGEPGPLSKRYAGLDASDEQRVQYLLSKLMGVPRERRRARFRCVIALVSPGGEAITVEGVCDGMIALEPHGKTGFGYDPIFFLPELGRTMAELSPAEKNRISHRGKAARKLLELLRQRHQTQR
ncbi:MAG: XTP/dITP diphosphatase [Chloroflexi bacterium]|nr:XTP/dITP diphosphatase [Chloroflexota bacterium]